jgi:hypothetical protein
LRGDNAVSVLLQRQAADECEQESSHYGSALQQTAEKQLVGHLALLLL